MNRPLRPLVPEDNFRDIDPALYVPRAAAAHLRAFVTGMTPVDAARAMYGADDRSTRAILRSATGAAKTQVSAWAQELTRLAVLATIQDAASISAGAAIISRSLSLDLGALGQLSVPSRPLTPADAAQFLPEGAPIPLRAFNFTTSALRPFALKSLTTYSRELSEASGIADVVKQTLAEKFGLGIDVAMLSTSAASASQSASLFNPHRLPRLRAAALRPCSRIFRRSLARWH